MLENVGRKVVLIVILLLCSLGLMIVPEKPFELGLDLRGGTRIVYRFDFAAARERGDISASESDAQILQQTQAILVNRINPTGTLDVVVRTEGTDRIVIELPGNTASAGTVQAETTLATAIDATSDLALELVDAQGFSDSGIVRIGEEEVRYARRDGGSLLELRRHQNGKTASHEAGAQVRLVNSDAIRTAIENLGDLAFFLMAEDRDFSGKSTDLQAEQQKFNDWQAANPGVKVTSFNKLAPDKGGPDPSIRWYPMNTGNPEPARPVLLPRTSEESFRGQDMRNIHATVDNLGWPAVGFEIRPERIDDFADFTGGNINRRMAIVLNEEIRSYPNLETKLVGGGIIQGKFQEKEVKDLITVLRSGSLRLRPELDKDERVGATLGDDYVQKGMYSSVFALALVVAFMIVYYRRLGVFSALALLTNLIMFMGGLVLFDATLTLPGIAGIVLTVGMAVDANILIFDRLREEAEKGRNPKQAAKAGFDMAMSAIIDSNVTTFLTAVILYRLGTGPVRGFAVTLMIGILTSVFAALVTTRVFVHWALAKKAEGFKMGRWMADANFDFLGKTKIAVVGSVLVCVGGLATFIGLPNHEKLGIDFTGGVEAQIETAKPEDIDTLRARVRAIPEIGDQAEVKAVLNSEQASGTYTQFRLQFKQLATLQGVDLGNELRPRIQESLKDILLQQALTVRLQPEGESTRVSAELFFEKSPSESEIKSTLEGIGLHDVQLTVGSRVGTFTASATTGPERTQEELEQAIEGAFRPLPDVAFAQPIPGFSQVGPQVVSELRDKALLALFVSLFITVIYIRVRFAEYSYGVAAMVALLHDVLVTLAALAIGNHFGIVNGEISLAMIAVFLTIIGYSVNDTIVIFDRVRENLPKSKAPLREVLNRSINETLSRTIMTSTTVFLAIFVQYVWNIGTGNVLESISFAMLFGTFSGVYSTVFIANPVFLWMETRSQKKKGGGAQVRAQRDEEQKRLERQRAETEEGDENLQKA